MSELTGNLVAATPLAPRRRMFARLRDRIVASDPAFSRLRLTSRAMLSILLSGMVLAAITVFWHPLPFAAYGLAIIISFMGSIGVRDATQIGQLVTRALAGISGIAVILIASVLSPMPVVADLAFLAIIFTAVYIRRFGPRAFVIGMVGFMSYFMGDYLHPKPEQIGWVALTTVIALAATHVVCALLLIDHPERDFRRAVTTIDRRINLILRELRRAARTENLGRDGRKELTGHLARLHDIILMAEGFIPQGDGGALAGTGAASDLAVSVFDLQLAVERLVSASLRALPPDRLCEAVLYSDETAIRQAAERLENAGGSNAVATQQVLIRVHRARQRLSAVLEKRPMPAFRQEPPDKTNAATDAEKTVKGKDSGSTGLVPESLHVPIQVTLASAIAIAGGLMISSTRWYWAVIAAFIVFNNTRSRADTAMRALHRSAGTLGGIVAGTIIATLLHDQVSVSIIGILLAFFVAFYFIQTSYGVAIFCITIALALLYGVMGLFTPQLLLLRLEETVIGALAGVFTAFFVFPKRATEGVSVALETYLDSLAKLVAAARERAHGQDQNSDILALSRQLDRNFADLANAARPLGGPWNVVTRYGDVCEKLLLLTGCTHWARALASSISHGKDLSAKDLDRFDELIADLIRQIERTSRAKQRFFIKQRSRGDVAAMPREPRRSLATREDESPMLAVEVMSALLERAASGVWSGNKAV